MRTVNVHETKTHLSRMLAEIEAGESFVIARAGKPVARLIAMEEKPPASGKRRMGFLKGQFVAPDDIKEPFREEIEQMFYGEDK